MKFLNVYDFIQELVAKYSETKTVYLTFIGNKAKEDKFGKLAATPILIYLIKNDGEKIRLNHDAILDLFDDTISVSLYKGMITNQGVACISISTEAKFSEKYKCNFYPRTYVSPGANIVKETREEAAKVEEAKKPQVFDI